VPGSKRPTFEQMSLLATERSSLCLAKMQKMDVSSKRIPTRHIFFWFRRQASVELHFRVISGSTQPLSEQWNTAMDGNKPIV
jgi:hypothetical protein